MNDLWPYILLGGLVFAVLYGCSNILVWAKLLRKGVLIEGRIEAHHRTYAPYYRFGSYSSSGGINNRKYFYLSLEYSYDCNGTNYVRVEIVDPDTYNELKDGDRVKVRCLFDNPTTVQLEASALMTPMRRYGVTTKVTQATYRGLLAKTRTSPTCVRLKDNFGCG